MSHRKHIVSITKTNNYLGKHSVYCPNHKKEHTFYGQNAEFLVLKEVVLIAATVI